MEIRGVMNQRSVKWRGSGPIAATPAFIWRITGRATDAETDAIALDETRLVQSRHKPEQRINCDMAFPNHP